MAGFLDQQMNVLVVGVSRVVLNMADHNGWTHYEI